MTDRLLTEQEIADIYFEADTVLKKTPENRRRWIEALEKHGDTLRKVCQAQADKERAACNQEWQEKIKAILADSDYYAIRSPKPALEKLLEAI
jgi:hypothetical protein